MTGGGLGDSEQPLYPALDVAQKGHLMPMWELKPVDLEHPDWNAGAHRGTALTRASDEQRARQIAENSGAAFIRFASEMAWTSWFDL